MDSSSSSPPLGPLADDDDLEEGQFVPAASHSSSDEAPYPPPPKQPRRLTLEEVLALGRGDDLPSPTPSSESDGTISDDSNLLSPASVFGSHPPPPKRVVVPQPQPLDAGWAATGKRGWAGGKPAPAAAPAPAPLILNNAQFSASHSSNVSSDSGSAHAVVHQPPPPFVAEQAPLLHLHQPPAAPAPQPQHPRREYTCKECGRSFPTNQALGGHAAGHRNRQREVEAAAAAAGMVPEGEDGAALRRARGGGREEATHECRKCGKVFATGVALGGHMRVHYTGPPIVPARKNKRRRLALLPVMEEVASPPPGLSLALSIKMEAEAQPSTPAPAGGARAVRLFGIDISPQVQAPSLEQQCSGMAADFSLTGGQQ
ncbi:unnamed protein product [Urochloa humidicola]